MPQARGVWVVEHNYRGSGWQLEAIFANEPATVDFIAARVQEHPSVKAEHFRVDIWAVHERWPPPDTDEEREELV